MAAAAQGAVAVDATSTSFNDHVAGGGSISWSHTVSGSNRLLVVGLTLGESAWQNTPTVTYAGQALTLVLRRDSRNGSSALWYLVNPPTGSNTVSIGTSSNNDSWIAGAVSLTGVDQTTPLRAGSSVAANSPQNGGSPITVAVPSAPGDLVVNHAALFCPDDSNPGPTLSPGAGVTQAYRYASALQPAYDNRSGAGGYSSGAASVNASWTWTAPCNGFGPSNPNWAIVAASVVPAAGAPPTVTTSAASAVGQTSATLNGSANPQGSASTGWFRYAASNPGSCSDTFGTKVPAAGTSLGAGTSAVAYSQPLSGLSPNTTYWFCAIASNGASTALGAVLSFTTAASPPTVTTAAAAGVGPTSATLNGSANPQGSASTGWFRYATTNPGSCNDSFGTRAPASGGASLGSGSSAVAFSQAVSGLTPGATVFYCALASNAGGVATGSVMSFTAPTAPTVTTSAASAVGQTSATLNGSANPRGSATTGWFRYATTDPVVCDDSFGTRSPATGGSALGSGSAPVAFSSTVSGLTLGATYFFCAIAGNSVGVSFGAVGSFTPTAAPAVATSSANSVSASGATLRGSANPQGSATTGWFRYAPTHPGSCNDSFGTRAPATGGTALGSGASPQGYSQAVAGLTGGVTYHFCAIASSAQGTGFGNVLSFTAGEPLGASCSSAATCASGRCVDGVCCDAACAGGCEVCNLAGSRGTCSAVPALQDPKGACGAGPCAGACDGSRACAYPGAQTSCGPCQACDGAGACAMAPDGSACADALYCNGEERCAQGACAAGAPVVCEPGGTDVGLCDEATRSCVVVAQAPPQLLHDALQTAPVGKPYLYNAAGAVHARGTSPMSFGTCGGPADFRVEPTTGEVSWVAPRAGPWNLCVFASNAYGQDQYAFRVEAVPASALPPVARIAVSPEEALAAAALSFDGSGSTADPSTSLVAFRWSFSDSRPPLVGPTGSSRFLLPLGGQTRLWVADGAGGEGQAVAGFRLLGPGGTRPPLARIVASQTSGTGSLTAELSCDCAEGDGRILAHRWTLSDGQTQHGPLARFTLPPGRYHVLLEVVDENHLLALDKVELAVLGEGNAPPRCALQLDPPAAQVPAAVAHLASFRDDDGAIAAHLLSAASLSSDQARLVAQYASPGAALATLEVRDDQGLTCSDRAFVRLVDAAGEELPHILSASKATLSCGVPWVHRPGAAGAGSITWRLDGEGPSGLSVDPSTGELRWTPTSSQAGAHEVRLRADGRAGSDVQAVQLEVECEARSARVGCACTEAPQGLIAWAALAGLWGRARRRRPPDGSTQAGPRA